MVWKVSAIFAFVFFWQNYGFFSFSVMILFVKICCDLMRCSFFEQFVDVSFSLNENLLILQFNYFTILLAVNIEIYLIVILIDMVEALYVASPANLI
ncbi:hypothetical protein [Methanobrevibacter sp.]|uniref:hypothetical protein n=1 Tax=Methanobrevibacter sp. TaxID=66852 RepID=UPI0026DFFD9E|nr:hypothetical protein [Methanobrevibacter sp.]MDO5860047.1 hypothetical protein [Methanobrevibacter sp.]